MCIYIYMINVEELDGVFTGKKNQYYVSLNINLLDHFTGVFFVLIMPSYFAIILHLCLEELPINPISNFKSMKIIIFVKQMIF